MATMGDEMNFKLNLGGSEIWLPDPEVDMTYWPKARFRNPEFKWLSFLKSFLKYSKKVCKDILFVLNQYFYIIQQNSYE